MKREVKGPGRAVFAAVLLLVAGVLNIIYGIAAIGNSHFFSQHSHYVFGSLKAWGWVMLFVGVLEILAMVSLFRGGNYGRIFAICVGSLAAIAALLHIPAHPLWSIAIFALSLWIIQGLTTAGSYDGWGEVPAGAGPSMHAVGPPPPM
jgi:hypothetical protein